MNHHSPVRHLKYLRQSLSQNNESIGFFISAGCPLSVELPTDKWPLIPDVKNLTIFINQQLDDNAKYKLLLTELEKAEKNADSALFCYIEMAISVVVTYQTIPFFSSTLPRSFHWCNLFPF